MLSSFRDERQATAELLLEARRSRSRGECNMDYLKAVTLQYIIFDVMQPDSKFSLIPAIGACLRFSPADKLAVNEAFSSRSNALSWLGGLSLTSAPASARVPFPPSTLNDESLGDDDVALMS